MADEDKPTGDAPQDGGTSPEDSQDQIDEAYKGKSLEDIIKMHKELKSHSDRQLETVKAEKDKEIAAKDKDLQAYQSWYQQQQRSNPQPTPDSQVDKTKVVDALLDDPEATFEDWYQRRRRAEAYQEAFSEGPSALAEAKRRRPELFEGIDDTALQQTVLGGVQSGQIHPSLAKKPEAWVMGAWQLRGVTTDFSATSAPPRPPTPPTADLPPSGKQQVTEKDEDDIEFDSLSYELMEGFGKTKEQAAKMISDWREKPDPRMSLTVKEDK